MATYGPVNLPAYFSNDAEYRTWIQGIRAALAACGLVQTADTGQINPATTTRPANSNFSGYEVWRFDDAAQATMPIFLKIEYGLSSAQDRAALAITPGTGSNGAGTITGAGTRRQVSQLNSKSAGVTLPLYASYEAGRFAIADHVDSTTLLVFAVERALDEGGVQQPADGWMYVGNQGGSFYNPALTAIKNFASGIAPGVGSAAASTGQAISPMGTTSLIGMVGWFTDKVNYGKNFVTYSTAELAMGLAVELPILGEDRTYFSLGSSFGAVIAESSNGVAMLLE